MSKLLHTKRYYCYVCRKEPWAWYGYIMNTNGGYMHFCETCKEIWVAWAMTKGVKFGMRGSTHNAHPLNRTEEEITELWKIFISKKIFKYGLREMVIFT